MRGSALDPQGTSAFWARPEGRGALRKGDIGGPLRLLRQWAGLSRTRIATATGISQGRLSEYATDKHAVTAVKAWERIGRLDNRFAGAHSRRTLVQYLPGEGSELLTGRYTGDVGRDLFGAVWEATLLAAWMLYDCGLHGLARRYLIQALRLAQAGDARQLASSVLSATSHQATFLAHCAEAVNLPRAALTGVSTVATPTLTAQFHGMEGRALARLGGAPACETALTAADRQLRAQQLPTYPSSSATSTPNWLHAASRSLPCRLPRRSATPLPPPAAPPGTPRRQPHRARLPRKGRRIRVVGEDRLTGCTRSRVR